MFGTVNSFQFTAMNTVTLKDLDNQQASSGNSMLTMVQMLSLSLGTAAAAAILTTSAGEFTKKMSGLTLLPSFHITFLSMGAITALSILIFRQLSPLKPAFENIPEPSPE